MSKTNANVFENANCIGRWNLFDSASKFAHKEAAKLCATCPVIASCERRRDEMLSTNATAAYLAEGTWAGRLLGPKVVRDVA